MRWRPRQERKKSDDRAGSKRTSERLCERPDRRARHHRGDGEMRVEASEHAAQRAIQSQGRCDSSPALNTKMVIARASAYASRCATNSGQIRRGSRNTRAISFRSASARNTEEHQRCGHDHDDQRHRLSEVAKDVGVTGDWQALGVENENRRERTRRSADSLRSTKS